MASFIKWSVVLVVFLLIATSPFTFSQQAADSQEAFEVSQRLMQIKMKIGESINREIRVFNKLSSELKLKAGMNGLSSIISLNTTEYSIPAHEEKVIQLSFSAQSEGVLIGSLFFSDSKGPKVIPVILEVESPEPKNAVKIEIPAEFRSAESGKDISLRVSILSLSTSEEKKVDIKYQIMDFSNKILFNDYESASFKGSQTLLRKFPVPSNISTGDYLIAAIVSDKNTTSTSTRVFSVKEGDVTIISILSNNVLYLLMGLIILVVLVLYLNYGKLVTIEKKRTKQITKIKEKIIRVEKIKVVKGPSQKVQEAQFKLNRKLESLKKAYKAGYISEEAYRKSKKQIETALRGAGKRFKRDKNQ